MKKNQIIRNNATGETLTMLVSDEENAGAYQLYEVGLPPHRPSPPLHYHEDFIETFTVKKGKLDMYADRDQKHLLLHPGESATAQIRQPHRFANDHDEPVIFTIETKPAGGVVKAFQLAYGIANDGGAAKDGLPKNPIARLVFVKTAQGYLLNIPRAFQRIAFSCAAFNSASHRAGEKVAGLFHLVASTPLRRIGEELLVTRHTLPVAHGYLQD